MARKKSFTADEVIAAMKGTGGIKRTVADRLGCTRKTVGTYINDYPTVYAAWLDERMALRDAAEVALIQQVKGGNYKAIAFTLTHLGEDGEFRPPTQRHELGGPDGGPIPHTFVDYRTTFHAGDTDTEE